MAPTWQAVGICDGGCGQVLGLSADRQTLVHYGDTHGAYMSCKRWSGVAEFMDQWQSIGTGLGAKDKYRQGVAVIESTVLAGTWFALTGDAVANAAATGGGVLGFVEATGPRGGGEGGKWTLRSSALMGAGNHNAAPLDSAWRCTGHLLVMEPNQSPGTTYLWGGGHGTGIQRAACTGVAGDATTWVRCQIAGSATGLSYVRSLAIDPGALTHVYASVLSSAGAFLGVHQSTNAHATTPNFTKLANQPTGNVHDLFPVGGFLYAACGSGGLWRMDLGALTWANCNGSFIPGSPNLWTAVSGYVDGSGNHVIWLGNFNPGHNSPATANHDGCWVSATIPSTWPGSGSITYADLPAVTHGTVPVPGGTRTFWRTQAAWNGGTGHFAPFMLIDASSLAAVKLYETGAAGPTRRVNATEGWTIAYNGYPAFLGHPVWASKATAGLGAQGDSDWGWIWWSTPSSGPGAGYPAWDASSTKNQTDTPPGGPECWAIAGDYYDDEVFAGTGAKYSGTASGGLGRRAGNSPGTANWTSIYDSTDWAGGVPLGVCVARDGAHDATGNKIVIAAVGGGHGIWRRSDAGGGWSQVDNAGGEGHWGPTGANRMPIDWQPGTGDMVAYDGNNGVFYSTDTGQHWYLLWGNTQTGARFMARFHPSHRGEVWVSNNSGVFKITNAHTGAVGSGATVSAAYPVANNGPLRWAKAGLIHPTNPVLVVAQDDTGNGGGVLYTADGGATWLNGSADKSFGQVNFGCEDMDIDGQTGVVYVSGSNVVAFGTIAATPTVPSSGAFTERQQSLNFSGAAGTISLWNNQASPPSGGAATLAGSALFCEMQMGDCAMTVTPADSNWVLVAEGKPGSSAGQARVQLWAYLNAPGGLYGDAAHLATWTYSTSGAVIKGKLYEETTPAGTLQFTDATGGGGAIASPSSPAALSQACTAANSYQGGLLRAMFGVVSSAALSGQSWAPGSGWSADGVISNLTNTFQGLRNTSTAGTATASDTVTWTGGGPVTSWAAAVASFYAIPGSPPTVTTTSAPNGALGQPYSLQLTETGGQGPFTWSATGLPPGLTLNAATGLISGIPSGSGGTYPVTVTVTDALAQSDSQALTITVPAVAISVHVTTGGLPPGTEGAAYQLTLTASGGKPPDTWTITGLPPGLTYDSATGIISGTPAAGSHGDWPVTISVTDTAGAVSGLLDEALAAITDEAGGTVDDEN